jgi:uncharacterized membrane protein YhaH (DUF805 family)
MINPMFVIEHGRGRYRLQPRTASGGLVFAVYLLALLAPGLAIIAFRLHPILHISLLLWGAVTTWLFFRWAKPRSKIIDLNAVEREYEAFLEWQKQQGRRR